jgi:hypothetical protein
MFYDIRMTCQEKQELMNLELFIISLSGESGGPGFLRMIPAEMIFRIGLGLPGKEQKEREDIIKKSP